MTPLSGRTSTASSTHGIAGLRKSSATQQPRCSANQFLRLFPPDRAAEEDDILERIRRGETVDHFETVRVRRDGTQIDISATISPIYDAHKMIVGASKVARDITYRKHAEQELRARADLLDLSHDSIMIRSFPGEIEFWNRGSEEMYGYSRKHAIGSITHVLLGTVFPRPLPEIESELLQTGGALMGRENSRTPRKAVYALWWIAAG